MTRLPCLPPCAVQVGVAKSLMAIDGLDRHQIKRDLQARSMPLAGTQMRSNSQLCLSEDRCVPLVGDSGAVLGMAVCPGETTNPIFVSVGEWYAFRF